MKVYELGWDYTHLIDQEEDCSVVKFEALDEFRFQLGGIQKYIPDRIILLQGNFDIIPDKSDFPVLDIGVPLMSKEMVSILDEDVSIELNKIDTIIVDNTYLGPLYEKDKLKEDLPKNNNYQFVQVLSFVDVFDRDYSVFKSLRSNPNKIGVINKLVLKSLSNSFPAIFRIEEKPSLLFINETTKRKFEDKEIKGCVFKEIEVTLT